MMKTRLLLAEDDEMLARLLEYRLQKEGFEVVVAPDGKTVMTQLESGLPDLFICDIMLPYMSGFELLDHVRNELGSKMPIIMISSAGNEKNVLDAFDMGANDFVTKPVNPSELTARVRKELKIRH
ncbi:response regulator transcription factor [Sediminicola luteus]|uniref:Response regulator n=1 Tax=Sediminicola luteus TaxID=319238 RepID=A0A2A4G7G8_9FLAO|nr:response regulator transcription factor [Sediminicola luteus]PCE63928.1 response regulator [Sediminicola luteus]